MKREKISLFILVVEIAVIALLHSAKNDKTVVEDLASKNAASTTYQLKTNVPVSIIK